MRQHGDRFLETHRAWVTGQHRRVLRAIAQCRTAALGGHRDRCEQCAQPALSYNSCRDRHCPKCLTAARNAWVAAREAGTPARRVRPPRLHDAGAARACSRSPTSAWCTTSCFRPPRRRCCQVAANPKRLGGDVGGLMVLHTWGQRLQHHPHVHCVVPTGGLSPDGTRWIHARPTLLPPDPRPAAGLSRQTRRRLARRVSRRPPVVSRAASPPLGTDARLSRVSPIPLSSAVGGLRQAALWQPRPRAALPRALHPPRRHLESPARRRDRRHRLLSLEGLSARQSGADAHARRRRVSPPLSAARPAEALRPYPLFRLPRLALPHPRARPVSSGARPSPHPHRSNRPACTPPRVVAVSSLWRAHAHRRTTDRATALSRRAPRGHHS